MNTKLEAFHQPGAGYETTHEQIQTAPCSSNNMLLQGDWNLDLT